MNNSYTFKKQTYKELYIKERFVVRAGSGSNVNIATDLENGDSFGGVTLATNDLVLLKNQSTSSQNGVYVVQASGSALRHSSYNTAESLNQVRIFVNEGTLINTNWYQQNVLGSLSDAQSWLSTIPTLNFVVPNGVYFLHVLLTGGGGGGGGGGGSNTPSGAASAGAGGAGSTPSKFTVPVVPGETITVALGQGGQGGNGGATAGNGAAGAAGGNTIITGSLFVIKGYGADGGANGLGNETGGVNSTAGSAYANTTAIKQFDASPGGDGGGTGPTSTPGEAGAAAIETAWVPTPATGGAGGAQAGAGARSPGGGGAGGSSINAGGNGGPAGGAAGSPSASNGGGAGKNGSGGGGGGGSGPNSGVGFFGGTGGDGYARFDW